jgi:hypothetical protein
MSEFGEQTFKFTDMSTHSANMYEHITKVPTVSIVVKQTEGNVTLAQHKAGSYQRVILVRYTGEIREVDPDEYEQFKTKLPEGIYQPISFTWVLMDIKGINQHEVNLKEVNNVLSLIDGSLQNTVKQWFAPQLGPAGKSTGTRQLAIDIEAYNSTLTSNYTPTMLNDNNTPRG